MAEPGVRTTHVPVSADTLRSPRPQDHLRPFRPVPASASATSTSTTYSTTEPLTTVYTTQPNGTTRTSTIDEADDDDDLPDLPTLVARIYARVQAFLSETHPPESLLASVQRQTQISLEVVWSALSQYKLSELSVSYNGGKDCLVLLILFLAGLHPYPRHTPNELDAGTAAAAQAVAATVIPAIYALPPDPFPAVEDFVVTSAQAYHLSITKYTTAPPQTTLRSSFEDYLNRHPGIRAIFVGTRRTDPHGARLTHFDRTDRGWPDFVRIHPVIDWHYAEIWAFIRHLGLRYCSLYDEGYTSLGGTSDTHPNPRLQVGADGPSPDRQYLPAYALTEDVEERLGRN
ncbi:hypothetical protein NUU61_004590 [Penicillium alfredii]|uniref:FAD synthase n=1 Tax=Penicillium alfredii TaxID=1506179 RepID=A0A9W9FLE8_9EURO|nr:uncharacterized protein NUU61_004590 [Penicillium alfredii]KAJ5102368.1 hypothetical protein NUU61_004590 [Penicillium alfredii]